MKYYQVKYITPFNMYIISSNNNTSNVIFANVKLVP